MIKKYVKRPIPVEACQWTGENLSEIKEFTEDNYFFKSPVSQDTFMGYYTCPIYIKTLEGDMMAPIGSYIIKGVRGEFYPCDREIFEETYQEVENE